MKRKKPEFLRRDWNVKGFDSWRKPRGLHNKLRLRLKGHGKVPRVGYGNPADVRFTIEGKYPVLVNNEKDLLNIDKEKQLAIIASNVGKKKKLKLLEKANELGVKVLNVSKEKIVEKINKIKEEKAKKKAKKAKKEKPKKESKTETEKPETKEIEAKEKRLEKVEKEIKEKMKKSEA